MDFKQEAQLPQRDSASATHVFPGSLNDRALHWTPHLLYNYTKWPHISRYQTDRWCCIMCVITKLSGSTPVRCLSAVNPGENSYKPHMHWNHSSLGTFLSLTVKAHVHSVTHGQLRKPQHTYVKRAVRKAHFKINWALKVIQGHPYWISAGTNKDDLEWPWVPNSSVARVYPKR